jgi:MFS transporter, DHA2 family, methylenomycin A resistance protein
MGMAAATFTASRQTGGMLGVAVLGAMVSGTAFVDGMRLSLAVCAVAFAVCAVAVALVLAPGPQPASGG